MSIHLIRDINSTQDTQMRLARLAGRLSALEAKEVITLLEEIQTSALTGHAGARELLITLGALNTLGQYLETDTLRQWHDEAASQDSVILALLSTIPPKMSANLAHTNDLNEQMEDVPLGRRKALARQTKKRVIEQTRNDNHPSVIQILLNNPRLTESDVTYMAAKQPASSKALSTIGLHPKWGQRYVVRLSLANNAYSPPSMVLTLLPTLRHTDLKALVQNLKVHRCVRQRSRELLSSRNIKMRQYREVEATTARIQRTDFSTENSESNLAQALIEASIQRDKAENEQPVQPVALHLVQGRKDQRQAALLASASNFLNDLTARNPHYGDDVVEVSIRSSTPKPSPEIKAPPPPPIDEATADQIAAEFLENLGPIKLVPVGEAELDDIEGEKQEASTNSWDLESLLSAEELESGLGDLTLIPVSDDAS